MRRARDDLPRNCNHRECGPHPASWESPHRCKIRAEPASHPAKVRTALTGFDGGSLGHVARIMKRFGVRWELAAADVVAISARGACNQFAEIDILPRELRRAV